MNSFSFFLARTYLFKNAYNNNVSTMIYICFIAIGISSFCLALVTAVFNGFEEATHTALKGVNPQIIIRGFGQPLHTDMLLKVLYEEFDSIESVSSQTIRHGIVSVKNKNYSEKKVAMIIAIDPLKECMVTALEKKIISPQSKTLKECIYDNTVLIGEDMINTLQTKIYDSIQLLFYENDTEPYNNQEMTFNKITLRLGGTFKTGIYEFDNNVIYCSLPFFATLFPDAGVEQLNIQLKSGYDELQVINTLKERLQLEVYSWKDFYPALLAALRLEKYVGFLVVSLLLFIASMNIISLLFMYITYKKSDIALLKAIGCNSVTLECVFFYIGIIITSIASVIGLFLACLVSYFIDTYKIISLPDAYYVSHVPAKMNSIIVISVFVIVVIISFFASWIPARRLRFIHIANVLKFEE